MLLDKKMRNNKLAFKIRGNKIDDANITSAIIKKLLKSPRELLARKVIKTINKMTRIRLFRLLLETLFQIT